MNQKLSKLLALLLLVGTLQAQDLPQAFRFSDDNLRLIRGGAASDGLYDETKIDTIFLYFDQPDYWQQMVANWQSKTDIAATMIYKGQTFDSIGARFRGQTSYTFTQGSQKKSFNLTLDWVNGDQKIDGYETLNLINGYEDATFMKEALYLNRSRHHIASAKANWVQLFINDQNWGIYVNIQQLDRQHAKEWFTDRNATRWRAEKTTSGPGFGTGFSTLNWLGWDTATYQNYYTLKKSYKENPWDDLANACFVLNNTPSNLLVDSLAKYLDIDAALWFLAHEILYTDDDSYINKGGMDYYLYFDVATNRLVPIEYDANSCLSVQKATQWSPFYRETNTQYPLMNKLMAVPELRQRYLAHVRTIIGESFNIEMINTQIDQYADLIAQNVMDDPKKLYTNAQFTQGVTQVKQFFNTRRTYILNNAEVNRTGSTIGNVVFSVDGQNFVSPNPTQSVDVTASVTATQGVFRVNLYYGTGYMGHFAKIEMFDDGNHNDGEAGDGIFGAQIPPMPSNTFVRFYFEALANDTWKTASYEPAGAEHDVYFFQVTQGYANDVPVVINELMSDNVSAVPDPAGEFDDWVELYNNSSDPFDLSGFYLSDKLDELDRWQFPAGTIIEGNGFLIIWCDNDLTQSGLHANFALSKSGESVYLTTPDMMIADGVVFGPSDPDMAYARVPNGTGNFQWQQHTFNAPNNLQFTTPVVINELMPDNINAVSDPNGDFDDWIEFYNPTGDAVDLSGFYLSINADIPDMWQFPEATTIEGYGYLIVWCDNEPGQPGLHANFALNNYAGGVFFNFPDLQPADLVEYMGAAIDISFARVPNGTGNFQWQQHTFASHNGPFFECAVVVNELMSDNVSAVPDPDGEYDDWVELYNNSSEPFNLSGFYLSDKTNELNRWQFPEGTIIDGLGFLIVWCDNDENQSGLHANFSLSKDGENVILSSPYLQIIDNVEFGASGPDMAYARVPNGTGNFVWQQPTFNEPNVPVTIPNDAQTHLELFFYPNPAGEMIYFESGSQTESRIEIYSLIGDLLHQQSFTGQGQINVAGWPAGIYLVALNNGRMQKLILH